MASKHSEMEALAIELRGKYLQELTWLEKVVDIYISHFFCGDNRQRNIDMQLMFLGDNRTNLDAKRQVFHKIAGKYDAEWYAKYPNLNSTYISIIENRNVFAHCLLDTSEDVVRNFSGKLTFLKFKNDPKPFTYGNSSFTRLMLDMKDIYSLYTEKLIRN